MKTFTVLSCALLFCMAVPTYSQTGWYEIPSGVDSNCSLSSIFFINENTGYVTARYLFQNLSFVLKTTDGGTTWDSLTGMGTNLYNSHFLNASTGFIVGTADGGPTDHGQIHKTVNSGVNWNTAYPDMTSDFFDIHMLSETNGIACGVYHTPTTDRPVIVRTLDGDNWHTVFNLFHNPSRLYGINFINSQTGFVVGSGLNGASFIKTSNGGLNWSYNLVPFPAGLEFWDTHFKDENTGYVCGWNQYPSSFNDYGMIAKSTNGGENWTNIYTLDSARFSQFTFKNNIGYACGSNNDRGIIIKTTDGGDSWAIQRYFDTPLFKVFFVNDMVGFALGSSGKIYKTIDGGGTIGIQTISSEIPANFNLSQNYPNPFNPSTTIEFSLPERSDVVLKVYDITGSEIASLVQQPLSAGVYSYQFNGTLLESGIYFYRLSTKEYTQTKKMIFIK